MKNIVVLIICLLSPFAFGQKLDAWLTKESEQNPRAYLLRAAKFHPSTPAEAAGNLFVLGRCYENLNQEDLALKYYLLSKQKFEQLNLQEPAKDLALEIHQVISSQENYDKYGDHFLNEYFTYAKSTGSKERLALAYNEFAKEHYSQFDFEKRNNPETLDSAQALFEKGLSLASQTDNDVAKSKILSNLGVLQTTLGNYAAARDKLNVAREHILETGDQYDLFVNYFNYGNNYFLEEKYSEAISWFKQAEKIKIPKYKGKTIRVLYKKLMESYDAVNDQPNRRKYQQLFFNIDRQIKDEEQNVAIHDINVKYQVNKKNEQISSLEKFKDKFHKNRLIFGILLFLVFLLALYSFIRWKKLDYHRQKLEAEKQRMEQEKQKVEQEKQKVEEEKLVIEEKHIETVKELEKVKSIVTQDYIILKDKSKVYLNDLMYIKSEDHYLHAFTSDGKSHFVRGKLSQIMQELPPNFAKCHRSYIVNTNYIQSIHSGYVILKNKTEIPTSRSFKP